MFKFVLPALAAATLAAAPAAAQTNAAFTGPRVELNAGVEDVRNAPDFNDINYGAALGVDAPLGDRFTIGGEVAASNVFDNNGRQLGAAARLGYAINPRLLAFGRVGYTKVDLEHRNADGLTVGGGLNFALTPNLYTGLEYRYTDFEHNVGSHGARVGIGLRF